ncbi:MULTISPECIES: putative entry exclusion protein TrbK-alt [unclassified Xanthobacter]|uniref:putative entry exclusion protein TrbK-alt n=1 Tax=unclassified Xanthobacter TaxID=2623496 RepID=UPI001EDDD724|nr:MULTISPECIES: putative entry exclusion protein TrbK-alt [unclassified Xanthobacter]
MDFRIAARMIAVLALGAAMTIAVVALREAGVEHTPATPLHTPGGEPQPPARDGGELARCRDMGVAALDDPSCKKAWAESRRHFLGIREERPRP